MLTTTTKFTGEQETYNNRQSILWSLICIVLLFTCLHYEGNQNLNKTRLKEFMQASFIDIQVKECSCTVMKIFVEYF